jgi:restriction system protein
LRSHPERIDTHVLDQFPEFLEFRLGTGAATQPSSTDTQVDDATPQERIEGAYEELRAALAEKLLAHVEAQDDVFFEHGVLDVLVGMGYGGSRREAAERVGRSGDGGVDGLIREDKLGLDVIYVQAKKWAEDRHVGPRHIREFVGALQDAGASKAFSSRPLASHPKPQVAERQRIVVIDGRRADRTTSARCAARPWFGFCRAKD